MNDSGLLFERMKIVSKINDRFYQRRINFQN